MVRSHFLNFHSFPHLKVTALSPNHCISYSTLQHTEHPENTQRIPREHSVNIQRTLTSLPESPSTFTCFEGGDKFWPEYEKRRGTKNGFENGLMLLMDVETFENAQYSRWDTFGFPWNQAVLCFDTSSNRKAEGLIVSLSGNMERPLVGQGYMSHVYMLHVTGWSGLHLCRAWIFKPYVLLGGHFWF